MPSAPDALASSPESIHIPDHAELQAAQVRLTGHIRRTPLLEVHGDELGVPVRLLLKLESLQHTGSFKARGALNALLARDPPEAGVVAASGGNHGAAVAWAAARLRIPATVFVPSTSPALKAERIGAYGTDVRLVDGYYPQAAAAAEAFATQRGLLSVHAYDEPAVVAGQGTVGLEIIEDVPDVDSVLASVGGGGLAAGVMLACVGGPTVVPVEPLECPTLAAAMAAGHPVDVTVGGVAADSTGAGRAGAIAFEVFTRVGAKVVAVGDGDIVAARRWLWQHCRLLTEPGGAVALAALRSGAFRPRPGSTVVVVVCGANTSELP